MSIILDQHTKVVIEKEVSEIASEYRHAQGLILTETDLKCLLYNKLVQLPRFSLNEQTVDKGIFSKPVHAELSWYDDKGKLTIKPDITILDPQNLSILHAINEQLKLPSKNYSFKGDAIIFELKFIRNKLGITPKEFLTNKNSIMNDFTKIQRLFKRLKDEGAPDKVFCYFIIFNKTDKTCSEFKQFLGQNLAGFPYRIIYASGNVEFREK